jgi:hypothetical protein
MSGFSLPMAHITILYGYSYKIDIQITEITEEYIDRLTWTFILKKTGQNDSKNNVLIVGTYISTAGYQC